MKKESKQSPKTKSRKRPGTAKPITVRVPTDTYTSIEKLAGDYGMDVPAFINLYIQQAIVQEAPDSLPTDNSIESSIYANQQNDAGYKSITFIRNRGIKHEQFGISSPSFLGVYFKNFILAAAMCIATLAVAYFVPNMLIFMFFGVRILFAVSLIWSFLQVVIGSIRRKDGSRLLVSGIGWFLGTLSAAIFGMYYLALIELVEHNRFRALLVLGTGIIFIGLLVNVPVEINNVLVKRREKHVNEHLPEWGEDICHAIINRELQPDMTREMALLAWGQPTIIESQESTKDRFTEKWIYKSKPKTLHVWFVNGLVNKINDSGN